MNEFELIARLSQKLPSHPAVVVGAGDDCAVLDLGLPGQYLLFKTDAVVEGVHFEAGTAPEQVGYKALARCLSDIAAMGGTPVSALVTLGLPRQFDSDFVEKVYAGMGRLASEVGMGISGGETTSNPDRLFLSIALVGTAPREKCIGRSGALAGDGIFVTGELGGSLLGRHMEFQPRLAEARWLAENFSLHAMIDLSDGLAGDLRHILERSGVGAELLASAIPVSGAARQQARQNGQAKPPLVAALTDGEDFELLFTLPASEAVPLVDGWKNKFPNLKLSCIGRITATKGLKLRDEHGTRELSGGGFDHFAKPGGG